MTALILVYLLFLAAILAAFLIPNSKVSKHESDHRYE